MPSSSCCREPARRVAGGCGCSKPKPAWTTVSDPLPSSSFAEAINQCFSWCEGRWSSSGKGLRSHVAALVRQSLDCGAAGVLVHRMPAGYWPRCQRFRVFLNGLGRDGGCRCFSALDHPVFRAGLHQAFSNSRFCPPLTRSSLSRKLTSARDRMTLLLYIACPASAPRQFSATAEKNRMTSACQQRHSRRCRRSFRKKMQITSIMEPLASAGSMMWLRVARQARMNIVLSTGFTLSGRSALLIIADGYFRCGQKTRDHLADVIRGEAIAIRIVRLRHLPVGGWVVQ